MFLYGCFLFKSELLKKWEEVRSSKRKFFLGVLKGWLLLVLVTIFFGLLSAILRQILGLSEQGLNEANIQSTFKEQPLLIAVFACIIGPLVEELFFRQILLHCLQRHLPSWLSICVGRICFRLDPYAQFVFIRVGQCSWLLRWRSSLSIIYVNEKGNIYYPLMVHVLGNILSFIVLVIGSVQ